MARCDFMASDDFSLKLERMATDIDSVAKEAIYEGAKIVADEIKNSLEMNISMHSTGGLVESFGVTPITKDFYGWNCKVGFDGYDDHPSSKYPKGIPYQLIARSIESGTSFRAPQPFVRPAINKVRKKVEAKMGEVIERRTKEILG